MVCVAISFSFRSGVEQAQQEVVRLAVTRLHESRCLWRGCDAILNSTESLTRHVHVHAEENENAVCLLPPFSDYISERRVLGGAYLWVEGL